MKDPINVLFLQSFEKQYLYNNIKSHYIIILFITIYIHREGDASTHNIFDGDHSEIMVFIPLSPFFSHFHLV